MKQGEPILQPVHGTENLFRVAQDWKYGLDKHTILVVFAGFQFDGASIPRIFWPVIGNPWESDIVQAALVHDALYSAELLTRADSDHWLREIQRREGIGMIRRNIMYYAVRAGGWAVWRRHTPASVARARTQCALLTLP